MQDNPFVILGVDDSVTQNELYDAYKAKREQYLDKRFAPGEEGDRACEKLDEIETAYKDAERILKERVVVNDASDVYKKIEEALKAKKYDEAQDMLDNVPQRNAEWHFSQSIIYYHRGWLNDAKAQLQEAIDKEPYNTKYSDALKNLEAKTEKKSASGRGFYGSEQEGGRTYRDTNVDPDTNTVGGCTPCNCCSSLICADCCCECFGGDLISCC